MLRTSLRSARALGGKPIAPAAGRQWTAANSRQAALSSKRYFADQKKPDSDTHKPVVFPTSETKTTERVASVPIIDGEKSKASDVGQVPPTPPKPNDVKDKKPAAPASIDDVGETKATQAAAATPPPPSSTPPKPKKGFFRRLRNFVFTLMVLGAVGFSGGVWYCRINDTFHDFFTEYVPFGEQAVLYFEEMEFRKRFPKTRLSKERDNGEKIRIPAQSGASWRVADTTEGSGRQTSASPTPSSPKTESKPAAPKEAPKVEEKKAPVPEKKPEPKPAPAPVSKEPEVNEPSRAAPLKSIDLLELNDAREPVIQDLVHMVNDLILVINADGAHGKYGSTISKAKDDIVKVGGKLKALKTKIEKQSADEVREKVSEFDKAATELVSRVEKAMMNQELQWREEFETEMKNVRESYDERVKLLLEREKQLGDEKLQNKLLEQAVALKKEFVKGVKDHVEHEREGRLGKLEELSAAVADLEKLSLGWNDVVGSTLQTQQLHVAVECVRAKLEDASQPVPFIKELVALKEISSNNPTVNAAIASVNPASYQRGIFSSAQLIDRFRRVASEVRKASLLPDDAGVASHASSWMLSHVMFKKEGLAEGNDVESILTRAHTFLEEGDLDNAAREMNGLEGWAKTLSKDWLAEVRKVLEVRQALDVISTEARLQSLRVD